MNKYIRLIPRSLPRTLEFDPVTDCPEYVGHLVVVAMNERRL